MDNPFTLCALANVGDQLAVAGAVREGLDVTTEALRRTEVALGAHNGWVAVASSNRGEALNRLGRFAEARQAYQRSLDIWRNSNSDRFLIAWALTGLGIAYLGEGQPREALGPLEEAYEIRLEKHVDRSQLGEVRFALARALWDGRRDKVRARALAVAAATDFEAASQEAEKGGVDQWLALHPRTAAPRAPHVSASRKRETRSRSAG
jgi:tetratricopeptide (TPR) repeat protein